MSLCRVVLVQSCVAGAVTQGVTTRGRDFSSRTMLVFVQRPPSGGRLCQIVLASLHCCTHCWGEKKVDGLILSVGCTNRGKTPITHCYISHDGRKGLLFKKKRKKLALWGFCCANCVSRGVLVQFFRGNRGLGAGGSLGVRHPCLCFGRVTTVCEWSWAERKFHRKRLSERHV